MCRSHSQKASTPSLICSLIILRTLLTSRFDPHHCPTSSSSSTGNHHIPLCWTCCEELCNSLVVNQLRQNHVPDLHFNEEQSIFTYAKLLARDKLQMLIESLIEEVSDQMTVTWGITIDPEELRLVWYNPAGRSFIVNRLMVQVALDCARTSGCQEQDHGPNVTPTIFMHVSQPAVHLTTELSQGPAYSPYLPWFMNKSELRFCFTSNQVESPLFLFLYILFFQTLAQA